MRSNKLLLSIYSALHLDCCLWTTNLLFLKTFWNVLVQSYKTPMSRYYNSITSYWNTNRIYYRSAIYSETIVYNQCTIGRMCCVIFLLYLEISLVIDSESILEALDLFTCGLVGENRRVVGKKLKVNFIWINDKFIYSEYF